MTTNWQEVWRRLEQGQHAVVQSTGALPVPDPRQLHLLVVDCEAFPGPWGPLEEGCRLLRPFQRGTAQSLVDAAGERLRAGLRRRLLGEEPPPSELARYQHAFSVRAGAPRVALYLRGLDHADEASLSLVKRLVQTDVSVPLPLLLGFDSREPKGAAGELLAQLKRALPDAAFCWPDAAGGAPPAATEVRNWQRLTPASVRVLRAAATVGNRFESEVIARLLGVDELDVLAALQEAVDQDLRIEDRGHGVFRCDTTLGDALRQSTLPSLARAWHERLAQLFGGGPGPRPSVPAAPTPAMLATEALPNGVQSTPAAPEPDASPTPEELPAGPEATVTPPQPARQEEAPGLLETRSHATPDWEDPRSGLWWQRLHQAPAVPAAAASAPTAATAPPESPQPVPTLPVPTLPDADERRAAQHAEAAGRWDVATARHLAVAEQASLNGLHDVALTHATRALSLSGNVRDDEQRRRIRVSGLLLEGRARWRCSTTSPESSLTAALAALLECRKLLSEQDPPALRADLGCLIASVNYDLGTPAALEVALRELTASSKTLLDAGRPLEAACLLNDEAAVWVKIGDPVRAHHLLSRSREVFAKLVDSYPPARMELAETEHLLARLLLHAPPRPGRERDALQLGVEHGRAAAEAYQGMNQALPLARVWETLARLELRLGHTQQAARLLEQTQHAQVQLGDDIGLARSCAAAADVQAAMGDYGGSLQRLAESATLNMDKGLRAGIENNVATLRQLETALPSELQGAVRALERRLVQALGH